MDVALASQGLRGGWDVHAESAELVPNRVWGKVR